MKQLLRGLGAIREQGREVWRRGLNNLLGRDISERHAQNVARLFRRDIVPLLATTPTDERLSKVLLWTPMSPWPCMFLEFAILTNLRLRGHPIVAAICDGNLPHCEMERANFPRPACHDCRNKAETITDAFALPKKRLSDYVPGEEIRKFLETINAFSAAELQGYQYNGIDLGAFACRYLTTYFNGFVPLEREIGTARRILCGELLATLYAERVYHDIKPGTVFMLSGNLCQYYGAFRVLRKLGAHVVTWDEGGQKEDGFCFAHNACAGDVPLDELWQRECSRNLSTAERDAVHLYWESFRRGAVGDRNYHPSPETNVALLKERLGLTGKGRICVAFSNVVWDSNVLTKNVGFKSIEEWLRTLIDWFVEHPDDVLILRAHPGEKRIPLKEYETDEMSTLPQLLIKEYPKGLPGNIVIIPAEDNAYSYSLAAFADAIAVYTTNIGLELALEGRNVWVAGKSFYRSKGFTVDLESPTHLRAELDKPMWEKDISASQSELAHRFSHLWINRYTTRLPYLKRVRTIYPEVLFQDLRFLTPGNDPALDAIVSHFSRRTPILDVPPTTNATWKYASEPSGRWHRSEPTLPLDR